MKKLLYTLPFILFFSSSSHGLSVPGLFKGNYSPTKDPQKLEIQKEVLSKQLDFYIRDGIPDSPRRKSAVEELRTKIEAIEKQLKK